MTVLDKIKKVFTPNDGKKCVRIGYSHGECLCDKCIKLDIEREKNGYVPKFGD